VAAVDQDGALHEVGFEAGDGVFRDDVKIAEHVGDGTVAVAGFAFGKVNAVVHVHFTPCVASEDVENAVHFLFGRFAFDQAGGGDGSGIDHGVERTSADGVEADGVEGFTSGFDPDLIGDGGAAVVFQGDSVTEGLGD